MGRLTITKRHKRANSNVSLRIRQTQLSHKLQRESIREIHIAALSRANNFAASWCANTGRQGGPICLQG